MRQGEKQAATGSRRAPGFTLLEMLTVLMILSLLAILAIPAMGRLRNVALQTSCASNLRQLHQIFIHYASDHNGEFPAYNPEDVLGAGVEWNNWPWHFYRNGYLSGWELLRCPAAPKTWGSSGIYSHYAYNAWLPPPVGEPPPRPEWSWGRLANIPRPSTVILLMDGAYPNGTHPTSGYYFFADPTVTAHPRHNGQLNVLYVDGHVASSKNDAAKFANQYANKQN